MNNHDRDRDLEQQRYNARAARQIAGPTLGPDGAEGVDLVFRRPYLALEDLVRQHVRPGSTVLDLCCGDGTHSLTAARLGARVTASDLAENNLMVAQARATRAGLRIDTLLANAESIPLPEDSFDVVTCVGSLSYVNLELFLGEVVRLLRPGGAFIFVDSLNHNLIYQVNRWLHHQRGQRSRSTLMRMPTLSTLQRIRRDFPDLQVNYHGIFSFLVPILRLLGPDRAARWLELADRQLPWLHRYAFKIVGVGHTPAEIR
ncbi:MAG: class I SAM-dependent methyltransferase [Opitutaceae bacterium]